MLWYTVAMSTISNVTAEQLYGMPHDGMRYELVEGELRMMSPSGWKHGEVVGVFHTLLGSHIRQHRLGVIFGAETGFKISESPDTVRAPDIAFIAKENLPADEPKEGFWPGAPDLAIEVLSPSDQAEEVAAKTKMWLDSGVQQVWIVDPRKKSLTVHRSSGEVSVFNNDQLFESGEIVPGFSMSVAELIEPSK